MSMDKLLDLLPAPLEHGFRPDWQRLIESGIRKWPSDYSRFVEAYGPGVVDGFLYVLMPESGIGHLDLVEQARLQSDALGTLRRDGLLRRPIRIYPEPGGVIPWGVTDNGDTCFWNASRDDPEQWSVLIADDRATEWFEFEGGMADFLVQVLSVPRFCDAFPEDWPNASPKVESR